MDSAAGETCFSLSVLDDTVLEEPLECLLLRIQIPDDAPDMLGIAPDLLGIAPGNDSTLCCIMDDDSELVIMHGTQVAMIVVYTVYGGMIHHFTATISYSQFMLQQNEQSYCKLRN